MRPKKFKIELNSMRDYTELVSPNDITLTKILFEIIEKNLHTKRQIINDLCIYVHDVAVGIEINMARRDFPHILQDCLDIAEQLEEYELCAKIVNTQKIIATKNILQSLTNYLTKTKD